MRTDRLWSLGLFAAALLLRAIHIMTVRGTPLFEHLMLDARMYDEWGARIAAGDWLGQGPFFQDPLYPYLLGAIYALAGQSHTLVVLLQATAGAAVPVLLHDAALPWCGRPTARIAGIGAALYLPAIYYEGLILKTALAAFLVAAALALLSRALRSGGAWNWAGLGAVLGLAALARGNLLLLLPALAAWAAIARPAGERVSRWRVPLLLIAGAAVVLAPVTLRNRWLGGEWILATSNAGQNFYIGNNPGNEAGEYQRLAFVDPNPKYEERDFAREAQRRTGLEPTPATVSRYWFRQALDWIAAEPGDWLGLLVRKTRVYWGAYEVPDSLDYDLYRQSAPVLRLPLPGFGLVAPLGLLGLVFALRRPGWVRLLAAFVLLHAATVIAFFVFSRLRMSMMPAMHVLAAIALVELARRGKSGGLRSLAWPVGALLLCLAFVNLPVRAQADSLRFRVAQALGLPRSAETTATGRFNLGVTYAARAKQAPNAEALLERAEEQLRRAAELEPDQAEIRVELAKVLARRGRSAEAIEQFAEAERIEPGNSRHAYGIGLLRRREGDPTAAAAAFARALSLEPRNAAAATRLGEVLLELGQRERAAEAFRHALDLRPDDAAARAGLAEARDAP